MASTMPDLNTIHSDYFAKKQCIHVLHEPGSGLILTVTVGVIASPHPVTQSVSFRFTVHGAVPGLVS